jgi:hypothetical protein
MVRALAAHGQFGGHSIAPLIAWNAWLQKE